MSEAADPYRKNSLLKKQVCEWVAPDHVHLGSDDPYPL